MIKDDNKYLASRFLRKALNLFIKQENSFVLLNVILNNIIPSIDIQLKATLLNNILPYVILFNVILLDSILPKVILSQCLSA
jgi:hypothetical protein